jgi:hypothetical protein
VERRKACRFLVEKREGRGLLGRPRHKSEDNIEVDLNPYPANVENMVSY